MFLMAGRGCVPFATAGAPSCRRRILRERDAMDFSTAYASRSTAHGDFTATVTSPPRVFHSSHSNYTHEAFDATSASGPLEVVDNVDIAPPCQVRPGDRVEVSGEMVLDRG